MKKMQGTSVLAMAAAFALGTTALCTAQEQAREQGQQQRQQSAGQQGGQRELTQMQQQGQQVQQQVLQQLQQIRQQGGQEAPDKVFLLNTALGSTEEVVLSQQVAEKSQNQQVKQIAQQMIQDHSKMNQQIKQLAQQMQMNIPEGLTPMKLEEIQILTALPSEQLDKHYIAKMNEMHAHDVACFHGEAQLGQAQQVKQFASENLQTLQQHHHEVMQAAMQMGIMRQGEAEPAGSQIRGTGAAHEHTGTNSGGAGGTLGGGSSGAAGGNSGSSGTGGGGQGTR